MIKRFYSNIRKSPINITNNAWEKIREISKKSNNKYGFLFYVNSGGCNGFNYNLELLDKENYDELENSKIKQTIIYECDTKVYIDQRSEMFLIGTKIDYINENYSKNIFESKFIFTPDKNLATSCGCGISFTPKN
tara:strand:- start:741 stop:1145 length:405 start_codon:yes stop_codon:yes gene_type:complete